MMNLFHSISPIPFPAWREHTTAHLHWGVHGLSAAKELSLFFLPRKRSAGSLQPVKLIAFQVQNATFYRKIRIECIIQQLVRLYDFSAENARFRLLPLANLPVFLSLFLSFLFVFILIFSDCIYFFTFYR